MISTREVIKQIRAQLGQAFPGVRFSVRKGRGTGSAWIYVVWRGGPPAGEVRAICDPWPARRDALVEGISYFQPSASGALRSR